MGAWFFRRDRHLTIIILIFIAVVFPPMPLWAQVLDVCPSGSGISVSNMSFLKEEQSLPLSTVPALFHTGQFQETDRNYVNFGSTYHRYWMHFSLTGSDTDQQLMLEFNNPQLYRLQLYVGEKDSLSMLYNTGSDFPFAQRPFLYGNFVFPLHVKAGEKTDYFVLLDRRQEILKFTLNIYERQYFMQQYNRHYWQYGCFTGIVLFIILFSVFLSITLHAKIHLWYTLYILLMLMFVLADTGLGYEFLWGQFPILNKHAKTLLGMVAFPVQLQFMQLFISQQKGSLLFKLIRLNKALFMFLIVGFLIMIWRAWVLPVPAMMFFRICFYVAYVTGILLVFLSLAEKIRQGNRVALIYLAAVMMILVQVVIVMMIRWHLLDMTIDTSATMACCVLAEIILLTLGLTFRYNYYKKEKNKLELALANQQNALLQRVVEAVEEEKRRIAEDLHDGLGGTLAVIKGMVTGMDSSPARAPGALAADAAQLLDQACMDLRFIAHDLMPAAFHATSLGKALEEAVHKADLVSAEIQFTYIQSGTAFTLDQKTALCIYRMLLEMLHNIRKHARATQAIVQLTYFPQSVQLLVEDNGCGIASTVIEEQGIGLKNLYSRAEYINSKIHIDSGRNGTTIICDIPYNKDR
ncbi:signal transduction histidine kinase [Chitinophaga dinghuensis]|uniref:histidine kinase n=1 Tax=Chitinophaga dinghuensis TaxID=1539050 RepID=A0A327WC36_9BACT|nr:7TM diverse intracellular signaling domain-containing protein [Chitinophaga dinghuensis]RAJ87412.1 signal transduction histidine kinase [Chitinophaga dinghuensis]